MAGHFVLKSISTSDLTVAQQKGCTWSALQHGAGTPAGPGLPAHAGWTAATRANLTQALTPAGVPNRNLLPPHRYLGFGPFGAPPHAAGGLRDYIRGAGWADTLVRPPNMGLVALCPAALALWNAGDRNGAVVAQADHGHTSLEIYYIAGMEMS